MNELQRWQADMAQAVLAGGAKQATGLLAAIDDQHGVKPATRLAVYVDAYRLRGLEVLGEDYVALRQTLGNAGFEQLAGEYLAAHRSRHPSIRWLGKDFAKFLDRRGETGWMADLARFCWAMGEAHDAANAEPVSAAALAELPPTAWPGLTLHFHASFKLLSSHFDVAATWQQTENQAGDCPNAPTRLPHPVTWAIWRQAGGQAAWCRTQDSDETAILQRAMHGESFAQLAECLQSRGLKPDQAALSLAASLRSWLQREWITRLEHGS